jgi:hypothetical protein
LLPRVAAGLKSCTDGYGPSTAWPVTSRKNREREKDSHSARDDNVFLMIDLRQEEAVEVLRLSLADSLRMTSDFHFVGLLAVGQRLKAKT